MKKLNQIFKNILLVSIISIFVAGCLPDPGKAEPEAFKYELETLKLGGDVLLRFADEQHVNTTLNRDVKARAQEVIESEKKFGRYWEINKKSTSVTGMNQHDCLSLSYIWFKIWINYKTPKSRKDYEASCKPTDNRLMIGW